MKHTAELVAPQPDKGEKIYKGASGDRARVESILSSSRNKNAQIFSEYLRLISDKHKFAPNTEIQCGFVCAEPHAIAQALVAGEEPTTLRFKSITRHETGPKDESTGKSTLQLVPAAPCTGFCRKYISDNAVMWDQIVTHLQTAKSLQAEAARKAAEIGKPDEDNWIEQPKGGIKKAKQQAKRDGHQKISALSKQAFNAQSSNRKKGFK